MTSLYEDGVNICLNSEKICVRLAIIVCTIDLPAKASVFNMTFFNGAESCITCHEPGIIASQGKGFARCFPYCAEQFPLRTDNKIRVNMSLATDQLRISGFKGLFGLSNLKGLNFAYAVPPDYMHVILLGVTKSLLSKWFLPKESGNSYYIGKSLHVFSQRVKAIKPPFFRERLPRDLEKHYMNLKATELQLLLLYYCLPCLEEILPKAYLDHIALLSETTFI